MVRFHHPRLLGLSEATGASFGGSFHDIGGETNDRGSMVEKLQSLELYLRLTFTGITPAARWATLKAGSRRRFLILRRVAQSALRDLHALDLLTWP